MATANFYPSEHGIFAFAMDAVDELAYELEEDNVLYNLTTILEEQGHKVTVTNNGETSIEVDGLVKMNVMAGYYAGAQIIIDQLENQTIAEDNYLDLEDDYYQKLYVYLEDDEERWTATPDEDGLKASQIEAILYNVAWDGDNEEEPVQLADIVVTSINHPDYTMLDYQVVSALEKVTTKYTVAYQFGSGETGYTLAN